MTRYLHAMLSTGHWPVRKLQQDAVLGALQICREHRQCLFNAHYSGSGWWSDLGCDTDGSVSDCPESACLWSRVLCECSSLRPVGCTTLLHTAALLPHVWRLWTRHRPPADPHPPRHPPAQSTHSSFSSVSAAALLADRAGRSLTNCNLLLIPDYMTQIVVSDVIHYITHFR